MKNTSLSKQLPHSQQNEEIVLGTMLFNPACIGEVVERLQPEDFYIPQYKKVYEFLVGRHLLQQPINADLFLTDDSLDVELQSNLIHVQSTFTTPDQLETHIAYLKSMTRKRDVVTKCHYLLQVIYDEKDHEKLLDDVEKIVHSMSERTSHAIHIREGLQLAIAGLNNNAKASHLIPTGFAALDEIIRGFEPGQFIVLAARPSMGKTALALCLTHSILQQGHGVGFFTIEMTADQMSLRSLALESELSIDELYAKNLFEDVPKFQRMAEAASMIGNYQLYLDDTSKTIQALRSQTRKWKLENKIKLIVIDYLGLIRAPKSRDSKNMEIAEISEAIKELAKEVRLPILVLCQLNRQVENRPDNRPKLSDLRDSGAIEQDADIIMMLYREYYYNKEANEYVAELYINKNRNGKLGKVEMEFNPRIMKFS